MSESPILGPIQIEASIHLVHPDGHIAKVTFGFPPGKEVSADDIEEALKKSSSAVEEQGFVLMGPDTFFNNVLVKEKTGRAGRFATPNSFQFDAFGLETLELSRTTQQDFEDDEFEDEDE